jgi:glycosyltransferase involved in cell wall biosynthesis
MRILFDHQTFVYQNYGGISRYFVELVDRINKKVSDKCVVSALLSDNIYLREKKVSTTFTLMKRHFYFKMTIYNAIDRFVTLRYLKSKQFDLFHPTYYDTYFLKHIGKKPFVLTVLDMIHEQYPGMWPDQEEIVRNKALLIHRADHIIAISAHTKKDLLAFYPAIEPDKVTVIWLGNSVQGGVNESKVKVGLGIPYLLFVGKRDIYKNFKSFVTILTPYLKADRELRIVAAGGGVFTEKEEQYLRELGVERQIISYPQINDSDLAALYGNALSFVFPSAYEGFGIPIVEAFATGCPVILNNRSCLPEIGGNAALYFDEDSPSSLIEAVEKLRHNPTFRAELIALGKERVKLFDWDRTASETMRVYQSVIEKSGN